MFSERMKRLLSYTPGEQPQDRKYLKLNTNENPYPPSPLIKSVLDRFDIERLRLYPDPQCGRLREKLSLRYGLSKNQVFVANGSDEALSFCFYAFFGSEKGKLLFPQITYSFFPVYCSFYNIAYDAVPLNDDFTIDVGKYVEKIGCGVILPNPNAPTGIGLPLEKLAYLLDNYPKERVVVIDEAYVDFGAESAVGLIHKYPNLAVVRTFSKSMGLAGLRLGFVLASETLVSALFTVKDSFNSYPVDTLSQMIGETALSDEAYYRAITKEIISVRKDFSAALLDLGWSVLPSSSNFIFTRKSGLSGEEIYSNLKKQGILVRYFDLEPIKQFVRITIGKKEDMQRVLKTIKEF
ncbi:MAG: histidinol-phosphate transaminase [Deltaproteobacteria bacterium]|nr:histidinol-phosphate transaminase [Deltaproteobacteria bacterium]